MTDLEQKRSEVRQRLIDENEFPNIPKNWGVERLRFLFKESKERNGGSPVGEMLSVSEYRGVVPREYDNEEQKRTDDELENYRVVRPGQLAVNSMWLNHLGLGVSEHTGHVSPAYNVYDISCRLDRRFVHHLLRSNYYLKIYLRYLYGIRPNSFQIKSNDWASIPIIVPDLSTQREIADFLDRETARIDLLIEKKQKLVALLGEKQSALTERLVAFGPDYAVTTIRTPSVWLPEVAEGVELVPIKRVARLINGYAFSSDDLGENGVPVIRIGDVGAEIDTEAAKKFTGNPTRNLNQFVIRNGDILIAMTGATIGKFGVYLGEKPAYLNQRVGILRSHSINRRFLSNCLGTRTFVEQMKLFAYGGAQPNIGSGEIGSIIIPVPSPEVQIVVADIIGRETAKLTSTRDIITRSVDRLKEYRSALITAAVTGQIDVTTYAKSGATDRRLDAIQEEMGA